MLAPFSRQFAYLSLPALGLAATLQAHAACGGNESDFAPYQESFALYNKMRNPGWAGADESALRAFFSFKYTVFGQHYVPKRARLPDQVAAAECKPTDIEIFLSYTGSFDFYVGTRDSGPVINRLNNPAIGLRVPLRKVLPWGDADDNFIFSLEHRSDGQVLDPYDPLVRERANNAYATGNHAYFDAMSRGSNFVGLAVELTDFGTDWFDLRLKWRQHFDQESAVTWGPLANANPRISDYDRLQLQASYRTGFGWLDAGWRIGSKGVKTDSWTFGWQAPSRHFPLYIRYHRGPMNTLANYTQRQDSIGIGLRFARPFDGS
jgi:outer membrane phospholipase A